jgi:hypothetical protein
MAKNSSPEPLAACNGRLHCPDDAQAERREADVGRGAAAFVKRRTAGSPRNHPSCRGRADDCIARMMRKSNHVRSPSDAALLLCRASDYWFATQGIASSVGRRMPLADSRRGRSRHGEERCGHGASELSEANRSLAAVAETLGSRRGRCAKGRGGLVAAVVGGWAVRKVPALDGGVIALRAFSGR